MIIQHYFLHKRIFFFIGLIFLNLHLAALEKRSDNYPLYTRYPLIETALPSIELCDLPTPAYKLEHASKALGIDLYIKRDDLSNGEYGGNKNRTLEFFLADAQRMNADAIMTIGSAGSTHAVATAHTAAMEGFQHCYLELTPHPNSHEVWDLLLLMHQYGGLMHFYSSDKAREEGIKRIIADHKKKYGTVPYFIPAGGSAPLGIIGYVNAIFELKEQIEQGLLPEPDYIYVACGTKGTTAGLLLGVKVAGLKTRIIPVCIKATDLKTYVESICQLAREANDLLHEADATFPHVNINSRDFPFIHSCSGVEYGMFTRDGMAAKKFLYAKEQITLDGTYTAKAFGKLMDDARKGKLWGKKIVFWHTYCSSAVITDRDYKKLPPAARVYFEEPVQPLDR